MKNSPLRMLIMLATLALLAAPAFADPPNLVGSWSSVSTSDQTGQTTATLWTFGQDGTLIVSASVANASAGHGSWERTGGRTFEAVNEAFGFAPDGSLAFTLRNRATFEVNQGGETFDAAFSSEIVAPDGTVIATTSGTATGQRISVN